MTLFDLLTDQTGLESRRGRVWGAVVGLVTNNKDPEKLGRVKVKFPWLTDADESHWARVATFMAGKGRGGYFLPEVDDEVVVVFEHGDVRFPFVVGVLWNGVDAARYDNGDGKNNVRAITSRSGHELVFDDNAAQKKERLEIHTKAGHRIVLDDAGGAEKILIEDKSKKNRVEFDSVKGAIAVQAQLKLSLKAAQIEIDAGTTLKLKAGATLEIQGALVKIN